MTITEQVRCEAVLDVDGDELAGIDRADAEPLAGDHDDAVRGDLALDADRPGGDGRLDCLGDDAVADDMDEVAPSKRSATGATA